MNKKQLIGVQAAILLFTAVFSFAEDKTFMTGEEYTALNQTDRTAAVANLIEICKENGIKIKRDPIWYEGSVTAFYEQNPDTLKYDLRYPIFNTALISGDYDNGKPEVENFKVFYADGWETIYKKSQEARKKLKEAGFLY